MTVIVVGIAIILLIIIVFTICLYVSARRKRYSSHEPELFFQQQQNQFETSTDRQYSKPSEAKFTNCRLSSNSYTGNKDSWSSEKKSASSPHSMKKTDSGSSTNKLPTINEYVPDKLYISDPNDKFSKCWVDSFDDVTSDGLSSCRRYVCRVNVILEPA